MVVVGRVGEEGRPLGGGGEAIKGFQARKLMAPLKLKRPKQGWPNGPAGGLALRGWETAERTEFVGGQNLFILSFCFKRLMCKRFISSMKT